MLQHMGALFSPFSFQIDTWFHRAHCLFYLSICTTSRLMGTQPETPRRSWNILSARAPRLINGTLDSMINTCASSYYKKIGGNLRWPGIDFFPPLCPRTSSPLLSLPCPHPHDHGDYAEANQSAHQHNFWAFFAFHLTAGQFETHMHSFFYRCNRQMQGRSGSWTLNQWMNCELNSNVRKSKYTSDVCCCHERLSKTKTAADPTGLRLS